MVLLVGAALTSRIDVVANGRAAEPNGIGQDRTRQTGDEGGLSNEAIGWLQGMDAGGMQDLIGVDVADSRNACLVEQKRLDRTMTSRACLGESLPREGQGVGAEMRPDSFTKIRQGGNGAEAAKPPRVDESKVVRLITSRDRPHRVGVGRHRVTGTEQLKASAHPEMNHQHPSIIHFDCTLLALAVNRLHSAAMKHGPFGSGCTG